MIGKLKDFIYFLNKEDIMFSFLAFIIIVAVGIAIFFMLREIATELNFIGRVLSTTHTVYAKEVKDGLTAHWLRNLHRTLDSIYKLKAKK